MKCVQFGQLCATKTTKKSWVASAPADDKVLSALKVGQLEVITKDGTEIVEPLVQALNDTKRKIARRAS